jgi:hypothetical protein
MTETGLYSQSIATTEALKFEMIARIRGENAYGTDHLVEFRLVHTPDGVRYLIGGGLGGCTEPFDPETSQTVFIGSLTPETLLAIGRELGTSRDSVTDDSDTDNWDWDDYSWYATSFDHTEAFEFHKLASRLGD